MIRQSTRPTAKVLSTKSAAAAAFGLAFSAAVFVSAAPARAADDDVPLDSKILRGILEGIGLQKDGDNINYQERPPLVIPPTRALPPPERSDGVIANNPAWPKDPDVERKKEEAARRRAEPTSAEAQIRQEEGRMTEQQMTPGSKFYKPRSSASSGTTGSSPTDNDIGRRLSPSELGYKGGLFSKMFGSSDNENARFTGEPPRAALTEPPPGYQTPSPDQPYGVGAEASAPKPTDYLTTHTEGNKNQ
jgi:hypothetical protein